MKKTIAIAIMSIIAASRTFGAVTIAPASGALSADTAATAPGAAWSSLGAIVITEGNGVGNRDNFNIGSDATLVLKAPAGFEFNTAAPLSTSTTGTDITSSAAVVNDSTTITVTLTVTTVTNRDSLTISGLQARPTAPTPLAVGNIYRPSVGGGSAVIENVATSANADGSGGSNFGTLTEVGGAATTLSILTQPSTNAVAGEAFVQQPVLELRDQFGNVSTADTNTVVEAIGSASLLGSTTAVAVNGIVTFTNLAAADVGTLTIDFASAGLPTVTSEQIEVVAGPPRAAALVITAQPSAAATAGVTFTEQPVLAIYDQYGSPFTNDSVTVVTAAVASGSGTLQGTVTATAVDGVVTFADLYHNVANDISIDFSAAGLSNAVSQTVTVSPAAADRLVFTTQPGGAVATLAFATQPVVNAQDQFGNNSSVGLAANLDVTVALTNSAGVLSGTTTIDIGTSAGNGTATFSDLAIDVAGLSNQLVATASGLAEAISDNFEVANFVATQIVISQQPSSNAVAGVTFAQQPVVRIEDANGNLATTDNSTVVTVTANGTSGLQGTLQGTAVGGIVTFADLSYNTAEAITLSFSAFGLTGATSEAVVVEPAAAVSLAFTTEPAGGYAGSAFLTQPAVQSRDAFGNNSSVGLASNVTVTLTLTSGTGALIGTATADIGTDAGNGAATFVDVGVDTAGLDKQLTASAAGLTDATSALFDIGGVAAANVDVSADTAIGGFTTIIGPTYYEALSGDVGVGEIILNAPAGYEFDTTGAAPTVRIQKIAGPGNVGNIQGQGTFSGGANNAVWPVTSVTSSQIVFTVTSSSTIVADSLTWEGIRIRALDGANLTNGVITKTGSSVMAAVVDGVTVFANVQTVAGAVHHLVIEVQPSDVATAGVAFVQQPVIRLEDQFNRVSTNDNTSVITATINQGTGGFLGTTSVTATNGYAIFTDLAYTNAETITIDFATGAIPAVTSDSVVVGPAAAFALVFTTQPAGAVSGVPFAIQPVVTTVDVYGNPSAVDLPANLDVTVALTTGTGSLSGSTTVDIGTAAGNGTAAFANLQIDGADPVNQLTASAAGLVSGDSDVFAVTTADHLEYVDGDGQTGIAGSTLPINPTVRVVDTNGAPVADVVVSFNVVSGGGSVGSASVITDTNGLASTTFTLGGTAGESNNVLTASALVPGNPSSITFYASVEGGIPAQLAIVTQPSATAEAGVIFAQQPQVRIEDVFGNFLTNDNTTVVTVARGLGTGALQGTLSATAVNGIVTFTDLSHNVAGTIDLSFSSIGLVGTNSSTIEITPAPVAQLGFTTQPGTGRTDSLLDPQPVVQTQDQFGNNSTNGLPENLEVGLALTSGTGELIGLTNLNVGFAAGNGVAAFTNLTVSTGGIDKQLTAMATGLVDSVSATFRVGGVDPATMPIVPGFGTFVEATGPAYYEVASGDVGVGTVILNAPAGYQFDTNSPVTVVVRRIGGNGNPDQNINQAQNGNGTDFATTVTPTQITFVVTSSSTNTVVNSLTWEGIRVAAAVGIPDAESHITKTGTSVMAAVVDGVTSFGEVIGEPRPVRLVLVTAPSATAAAGAAFAQQPVVRVEDQFGNLWTNSSVTVTATAVGSASLQGTVSVGSVDGFAVFTDLAYNVAETISIDFSNVNLVGASSGDIVVSPGVASALAFTTQPGSAAFNQVFGIQPVVKTTDAFGNLSAIGLPATLNVTLAVSSGTGTLQGTTSLNIGTAGGNGTVAFTDLSINAAGDKQLTASASGLQDAVSDTFTVAKANQTITFGALANKAFGDAPFAISASASSGLTVSFTVVSGPATVSGNTVTITGTGLVTIEANQAGDDNYNAATPVQQSFTVFATGQTITFAPLPNRTLGDAPFTVSATASSGLPVTFSIVSGPATISGNTITVTNVGVVTVRASQGGDSNYAAAPDVDQSFSVMANQTITFGSLTNKLVSDAPFTISATASSGLPVSFTVVSGPATISSNLVTLTGAGGRVTIRATQAGDEFYNPAAPVEQSFLVRTGMLLAGDLDENGQADVFVQNTNGVLTVLLMDRTNVYERAIIRPDNTIAPGWTVVGQDDLNGDDKNDLLFQHTDGRLAAWFLDGTTYVSGQPLKNDLPVKPGWRVIGLSDFNADGKADFLFQHSNGQMAIWIMDGTSQIRGKLLNDGVAVRPGWKAVLARDLNGDGRGDILFQHADGRLVVWFMRGVNRTGTAALQQGPARSTSWRIVGAGDFNRDGDIDILWQDGAGNVSVWFLDGTSYLSADAITDIDLTDGDSIVGTK